MTEAATIAERVRKVATQFLVDHCDAEPTAITDDADWHQLNADSLDQVEITMALEDEFEHEIGGVDISDEQAEGMWSIAAAIRVVEAMLQEPVS